MRHSYFFCCLILLLLSSATNGCASPRAAAPHRQQTPTTVTYAKGISRLGYAIQMGAFSNVGNAERFTARLQDKGIEAFYFRKDNGLYAVRFGNFSTRQQARSAANRLVADRLIDSYYIAPPREVVFAAAPRQTVLQSSQPELRKPPLRPYAPPLPPQTEPSSPPPAGTANQHDLGYIAARTAERFIGIPYQWGGNTVVDGLDCSGFTKAVYNLCGVNIPRTSREQYRAGNAVSRDELQDGDLVFFGSSEASINHVGIYIGNGRFVHAPRRGEEIRTAALEESYFERRFVGARRYVQ